jgi:peptidoglycan hydrolase-like protein with peptidoglycan-binding domain
MIGAAVLTLLALASAPPAEPTTTMPAAGPTTTAPVTTTTVSDPLFPIEVGATSPAVAAIQGRLGITVDCDFGNQTEQAVVDWQTERTDLPETAQIGLADWVGLEVPITWGEDANDNGAIEPSEVTLVCDGNVELPQDSPLAILAESCGVSSADPDGDSYVQYSPDDDSITVARVQYELDDVADESTLSYKVACVASALPADVLSRIDSTRAIDGMQEAVFEDVTVFWNYQPDNGFNLTIYSN